MADLFKRRANRLCLSFEGYGFVPLADSEKDDTPVLVSPAPRRIGDDCLIDVEGQLRRARLLMSVHSTHPARFLVDMGPVRVRIPRPPKYVLRADRG